MKKWIEISSFGELYLEIVLVRFDIPLLFVCFDNRKDRYLVLCINEETGEYILAKCSNQMLLKMLTNEIPMDETFKHAFSGKSFLINYNFKENTFNIRKLNSNDISEEMLPDKGAYFELNNAKIKEYINKLNNEELEGLHFNIRSVISHFGATDVFYYDETTSEISNHEKFINRKSKVIIRSEIYAI